MHELPIPLTSICDENIVSSTLNNASELDETEQDVNDTQLAVNEANCSNSSNDLTNLSIQNDDSIISSTTDIPLPPNRVYLESDKDGQNDITPDQIEFDPIKIEPEFELDEEERNRFEQILNFDDESSYEDESLVVSNVTDPIESEDEPVLIGEVEIFPMPMPANLLGLTKRENDPISLTLEFNEKVSIFVYIHQMYNSAIFISNIHSILKSYPLKKHLSFFRKMVIESTESVMC